MRLSVAPDGPLERLGLLAGRVPLPLLQTFHGAVLAEAVVLGTELSLWELLRDEPRTAAALAEATQTRPEALRVLLDALVGAGYLVQSAEAYRLTTVSRTWLLADSPRSLRDSVLFKRLEWELLRGTRDFLTRGAPLDFYGRLDARGWTLYQRAMRQHAGLIAPELVLRLPSLKRARRLLDLGGGHGHHAAALLRRWPALEGEVVDLPEAIAVTEARDTAGVEGRLTFRAGDALTSDLGEAAYDVVLLGQLVHHFDDAVNGALVRRIARALRPGGLLVIQELLRTGTPRPDRQSELLLNLFFSLVSSAGTWDFPDMERWSVAAGLSPRRRARLVTAPGMCVYVARKEGTSP